MWQRPRAIPRTCKYHHEHDWARIEGDEATLGITWFAQDSLGELVHFEPPEDGREVAKGSSYGEVESVKAVWDLIPPLSGTVIEVNQKVVDEPETVNEDPYGDGWLVRIRLGDASEDGQPDGRCGLPGFRRRTVSFLSLTELTARRCSRRSGSTPSTSCSATFRRACASTASSISSRRSPSRAREPLEELAAKNVHTDEELSFLGAGVSDHYVPAVVDAVLRGGAPDRVHPLPARAEPGALQAIFEYQTAICELTGLDVSNASGYDGLTVAADAGYVAKHATGRPESWLAETLNPQVRQVVKT